MCSRRFKSLTDVTRTIPHTRLKSEGEIDNCYHLKEQLGKGSFGTVSEALRKSDHSSWAVKIINKEKAGSSAVKLLEREVVIMKKVDHPHIIHLEEVFETSNKMFLVMELCSQGCLDRLLTSVGHFQEKDALCISIQLIDAIDYMHRNDIIHRDLKLENILVAADEPYNIKLTDFGLSYTRGGSGSDYMMNQVVGTPVYMAPEVIISYGYSQQCDIWSAGVIIYKLLCGDAPFMALNEEDLFEFIKKGDVRFDSERWNHVPSSAKQMIEGMLRVDPAHRYTSKELLSHPWIKGDEEADSGPINVLEMMKEFGREQKLLAEKEKGTCNNEDDSSSCHGDSSSPKETDVSISKNCSEGSSMSKSATSIKSNNEKRAIPSYMQPTKSSRASRTARPK